MEVDKKEMYKTILDYMVARKTRVARYEGSSCIV